jgi:N-acetylneuraminic acid mutarotase
MAIVAIEDVCYVLGGLECTSILNQVFYASIDVLLCSAVPAIVSAEISSSNSSCTQTVWKSLPNMPTYLCGQVHVAATLADKLIIVGGEVTSNGEQNSNMVYMYSPSTSEWVHISDLPTPRSRATVVSLSSGEILLYDSCMQDCVLQMSCMVARLVRSHASQGL